MVVASTPTATDAWVERKKILDGNALLIQTRDSLMHEVAQWQPVLKAVREEVAAHLQLPDLTQRIDSLLSTKLMEQGAQNAPPPPPPEQPSPQGGAPQ